MFAYFDLIMQDYLEIDDTTAVYLVEVSKNEEDPQLNTYAIKALSSKLEKLSKDPHTGSTRYWPITTELLLANANDEDKKAAIFPESGNKLLSQTLPLAEGELTSRALSLSDIENYLKFNPHHTTPAIFSTEAARAIYSYVADNSLRELGIFEEDSNEDIFHEQMRIRESNINYEDYSRYVQRVISEHEDSSGEGSSFDARVAILKRRLGDLAQPIEGVHSGPGPLRERLFDVIDLQDELDNISVGWLALYKLDNKIVSIEAQIEELRIMKDTLTDKLGLLKTTIEQAEIVKNDSAEAGDASKASDVSGGHVPIYQTQLTQALQEAEDSFSALQSDVEAFGGERDEYDDTLRKIEVISTSLSEHVRSATQNIQVSKREARSSSEEVRLVRNMMESISNEKTRLMAVKRSDDPRRGMLDAMYTELKSHHENFIHLEKEPGSQISAKEKLIVNTLKTIDAYVGSKRLHDLSVGNSWVNFVRRTLLQPIHSLIKKWKEHPYQPQIFAGRTEKTIAQLANEVTLRFEKIAEDAGFVVKKPPARGLYGVLPKIVSSTTQTLTEQFQRANDKGAFILEHCLDENFYSNISSARFKEARKEACQRLVTDRKNYNFDELIIKLSDLCFSLKGPEFIRKGAGDFLGELLMELAKQTETEQNNFVTQYKESAAGYPANYQFSQDIAHAFSLIKQVAQAYDDKEEERNNKQYVARLPGNLVNKIFNNLVMASVTQQELSSVAARLRTDNNDNEERDKYFAERMAARQSVNATIVQEYLDSNARHKHAAYHHAIKTIGDIIETRGWGNGKSGHFFKGSEATASIAQLIRQYTDKGESTEDSLDKLYNAVCKKAKEVLDTSKGQKHAFYQNIVNDRYLIEAYKSSAHVDESNNEDRAARYHSLN